MKRISHLGFVAALMLALFTNLRGDGRPGVIEFSDGHKLSGKLSLSPGKELRIFTDAAPVSVSLTEVREMRFKVEKEEMRQGFYFPNAGQATQAKTSDVYPVRYFSVAITLADGRTITGHLMTTALYVETSQETKKVVLMAKMTGEDGQKLGDLAYPAAVRFDAGAPAGGMAQIDLTQAGFTLLRPPVIFVRPDFAQLPVPQVEGKPIWIVPADHAEAILFSVETADGIHVAWPAAQADSEVEIASIVNAALMEMHDFFDTRTLLGLTLEDDNIYSLVMLKRRGATDSFNAGTIPWSLVALRWKYDAEQKKVVLLNRINLASGRAKDNSPMPAVLKQPELLRDITAQPSP